MKGLTTVVFRSARWALAACLVLLLLGLPWPLHAAGEPALVLDVGGHTGPVRRLAVDPSGQWLVTASDDKTAIVWDLASRAVRHTLRVPVGADDVGRLYGVAVSPDGRTVALGGNTTAADGRVRIYLFDLQTGAFRASFPAGDGAIRDLAWSADGAFLASAHIGRPALRVFRADGGPVFEQALGGDAYGLSIAADGQLAVPSFDGRVRLFRLTPGGVLDEGEIRTTLADPVSVQHSSDGRLIAVGYFSRLSREAVLVDVFDVATRQRVRGFERRDVRTGNLMTVGWQPGGQALIVAGTGYTDAGRFVAKRIEWPGGATTTLVAAADSILDLAALPDGRVAFASFDAGWGVLDGAQVVARSASPVPRIASAASLLVSDDAQTVQWRVADGQTRSFALQQRRVADTTGASLRSPAASSMALRVTDWENHLRPAVGGRAVALLPNESSRAAAVLPDARSVVFGTSRAVRRVDRDGQPMWTAALHTEARAVNVSADGRLVVALLSDGTVRWRRAEDGRQLLSLLLLPDGRWVLWTDDGHFDAGVGAEDLVGWLVPRPGGEQADYFGASRLRERYYRPDVIDQVLGAGDAGRALQQANDALRAAAQPQPPEVLKTLDDRLASVPLVSSLPPVVSLEALPVVPPSATEVLVDVKVFATAGQRIETLSARVDGRPVEAQVVELKPLGNGQSEARLKVPLPKVEGRLQIFAEGSVGVSMPAGVELRAAGGAPPAKADRRPTLYLLAVGVSRYANPEYNLGFAAKDAQDFVRTMSRQDGVLYRQVEARVLVDQHATRAAVLQGLRWLQSVTTSDDVAMLFLAGHGVADASDVYHFLTHDVDERQLGRTAVTEAHLRSTLSSIRGRALLFVDTCYSGKSIGQLGRRELTRITNTLASAELGVIVFSGSAPRQESLEDPAWGNGAFTRAVVDGLEGRADFRREGVVTHKGLDYYVSDQVRKLTQGRQTPVTAVPTGITDFAVAAAALTRP